MLLEAIDWDQKRAIRERAKACNAHADTDAVGGAWYQLLNLALGLDRDGPQTGLMNEGK